MAGSGFGKSFRVTTFGESHGAALGAIVDGVPAGISLSEEDIQKILDRRRPGTSSVTTSRNESDKCRKDPDMRISDMIPSTALGIIVAVEEAQAERQSEE